MRDIYDGPWPLKDLTKSKYRTEQVASLYAKVFAGEPWREVSRCDTCGAFGASEAQENLPCSQCQKGKLSLEAYPLAETVQYIQKELDKPGSEAQSEVQVENIRMTMERIFGFAWGYPLLAKELAQSKYETENMQLLLVDLLVRAGIADSQFFYVSEVGVDPAEQGKGRGRRLTASVIRAGEEFSRNTVLRTNENSPMRWIAEKLGMKPILGLSTGIRDEENEARVLFIGGPDAR